MVDMEIIDSIWTWKLKRDSQGYWCLNVIGDKHAPIVVSRASETKKDRERGHFEKMVPLRRFDKPKQRIDPPEGTKNGVVHWVFEFNPEDDE